ncbi:MAG: hypothetical protein V2B18_01750 [Pseudomonadota bacterium]
MAEFTSYERERVEVLGEVLESFVLGCPEDLHDFCLSVFDANGISGIDPNKFYKAQQFLNAMKDIGQRTGRNMLTRIGERIAMRVKLPTGLDGLDAVFDGLNRGYHSKYRGGEIGHWKYEPQGLVGGLNRGIMVSTNHYCCAFDRGVLEGLAKRFRPDGITDVVVRHDDSQPCRKDGSDSCTYVISWM